MEKRLIIVLWLDDIRNPWEHQWKRMIDSFDPINVTCPYWVKNYAEFINWIQLNGLPEIISFDHDLADEHYTPEEYWNDYDSSKAYQESMEYTEKTGYDCAKWLVDYCIDNDIDLPKYYCHSFNPVGKDNILGLLNNFKKNYE